MNAPRSYTFPSVIVSLEASTCNIRIDDVYLGLQIKITNICTTYLFRTINKFRIFYCMMEMEQVGMKWMVRKLDTVPPRRRWPLSPTTSLASPALAMDVVSDLQTTVGNYVPACSSGEIKATDPVLCYELPGKDLDVLGRRPLPRTDALFVNLGVRFE